MENLFGCLTKLLKTAHLAFPSETPKCRALPCQGVSLMPHAQKKPSPGGKEITIVFAVSTRRHTMQVSIIAILGTMFLATGCVKTISFEAQPSPVFQVSSPDVAVVSSDSNCRVIANAIARYLTEEVGLAVRPNAEVRLEVSDCGHSVRPVVDLVQEIDNRRGVIFQKRILQLRGRGYAQMAVITKNGVEARLVGSAQIHSLQANTRGILVSKRRVSKHLLELLALDLTEQVRPFPRTVQRRMYRNPAPGSAHDLFNQAVQAEIAGDLRSAIQLLITAQRAAPRLRADGYLRDLELRLNQTNPSH